MSRGGVARTEHRGTGWSAAEAYERSFGRLCAGTVPALLEAVGDARSILDVGTGPGTAAAALAAHGRPVVAVDADEAMVELARRRLSDVDVRVAALPTLPFGDTAFDAVVANFVVNHVPDPGVATTELLRVGRTVALTIWPSDVSALNRLWNAVREHAGVPEPASTRLQPELDFPRSTAGLESMVKEAGATRTEVSTVSWTFRIDADALWSGVEAGIAQIGAAWMLADPRGRAGLRRAFCELSEPYRSGSALEVGSVALLAVASP